ncbi:MAG: hypothetical protein CMM54_00075 [Rhodospirillaceae bacterium]|nr:hypothetical protein [Rhodospirillaceae bacterium]
MARPTKLTDERREAICRMIVEGVPLKTAARAAGVTYNTLRNWMQRGEKGDEPYALFKEEVEEAQAVCEAQLVGIIKSAAVQESGGEWRAALALLSRKFPERWSEKRQLEVSSPEQTSTQLVAGMFAQVQAHLGISTEEAENDEPDDS